MQVDVGRSEPDGSETNKSVEAEQNLKSSTLPPYHSDNKHCHCICHLPQPGMKLMWVPVEDTEDKTHAGQITKNKSLQGGDKSLGVEDTLQRERTSNLVPNITVKSPTMPQCYSCHSFRLHHSQQEDSASEGVYESMDLFFCSPPVEEPMYLQLQPSDHVSQTSLSRPMPPPRPLYTLREAQKERRRTQPVLAYVLSPRGGRPPIRAHSSCGSPSFRQPKLELLQHVSSAPHRRCVSECVMRGEVTLWQHLGAVKQSEVLHTLTYRERQRQECMFEVMTSEASYLRSLNVLKDHFLGSRELDDTLVIHDRKSLFSNILQVHELIKEANTQVGQMKQMEELIHIATVLEFDKLKAIPLVSRTRCLEKQGELQELIKGGSMFSFRFRFNPVYIFLFNDIIILTRRSSVNADRYLVVDHAHRSLVQVQTLEGGTPSEHTFCLIMLENYQGKMCERVLKANTESDLHRWTAAFPSVSMTPELKDEKVYTDWDCPQVQCIQQYVAKQADELSLEPSDIINVLRKTKEGWWEGIRLSDQTAGWFPQYVVTEVTNEHQRRRNLREQYRISQAANHSLPK
ncbi:Ephexin-1 [Bagarius yarrelli]|uniref:Ephexin-1 n=1 Tax=Bagarius yarrelli TaxID=175774 RepID=A0A556VVB2_BAGYA|nr:Ephexin-1 [Bagarius yarrelli]